MRSVRGSHHRSAWGRAGVIVLFALATATALSAKDVPFLAGRVNDLGEMLSANAESRLDAMLESLERDTGAQVVVLTVPSLEGDALESYTERVASTWQLGRKDVNDGALLFIARDDRKMRLEVGYGLEPIIPDILAGRVLNDVIRPNFKAGRFEPGIIEGVRAIDGLIRKDPNALPAPGRNQANGPADVIPFVFMLLFFGVAGVRAPAGIAWLHFGLLAVFWGVLGAALLSFPFWLILPAVWGIVFVVLRIVLRRLPMFTNVGSGSWSSSRGWTSGGSGWSGGGGFSGGGGSFGGGGASSGW